MRTIWIFGDGLNRRIASLDGVAPDAARILLIESEATLRSRRFHRQRLHLVLAAMRTFAAELRAEGFDVDLRPAPSFAAGLAAHRAAHRPSAVVAAEPLSAAAVRLCREHGVDLLRSNQLLCHYEDFAAWAGSRARLTMGDFYRWQRKRLGILMDGDAPAGGRWSFDDENRQPPPRGGGR